MANVINRTTLEPRYSVHPDDHPDPPWLHLGTNPDGTAPEIEALGGEPRKYWTLTGDVLSVMDQAGKDAVDAAEAAAVLLADQTAASATVDDAGRSGLVTRGDIEQWAKRLNYLTNRIIELQDALLAMKASSGPADNIRGAIPASFLATQTKARGAYQTEMQADIEAGVVNS